MRKILMYLVVTLAIAYNATAWGEGVLLRYKYTEGDQLLYVMNATGEGSMKMSVISGDIDESKIPKEIPLEMAMKMTMKSVVNAVNEQGDATIETKIRSYGLKQNGMDLLSYDDSVESNSESPVSAMFDEPFTMVVSTRGEVKEFKGLESLKQLNPQMDVSQMLSQFQQPFPENPVNVGEKWKQNGPTNVSGEGAQDMGLETEYEFLGFEDVKGLNCAKINMEITGDFSKTMKDMFAGMLGALGGKLDELEIITKGTMYFEPVAGVLVAAKFNIDQKMVMSIKPPESDGAEMSMIMDMNMEGVYELE